MDSGTELKIDRSAKTLRELTLEKLRDAILGFSFRPGERLVERALCEKLGVSRTVVREALRHLEAEGLVESLPQQGPIVARPDPSKAAQIYEIRALLEAEAALSCAHRATPDDLSLLEGAIDSIEKAFAEENLRKVLQGTTRFYEILFSCAEKPVAWSIVQLLNARINQLRALTISAPGRSDAAPREMRLIYEAIKAKDGRRAYNASIAHVETVAALAQEALAGLSPPSARADNKDLP
jgi:DNA-binding GntR family transcriptional regulator